MECIDIMIKPCNQPLKNNPFTCYRDPVTGRWTVVDTVQNACEPDSSLTSIAESPEAAKKVEAIIAASPAVSSPSKPLSFSLPSFKKPVKKSAVKVSS